MVMNYEVTIVLKGLTCTLDLPSALTPPTKRGIHSSPTVVTRVATSRNTTPSHELETGDDTDSSNEEPIVAPPKILVRRFTLADPLMMPGTYVKITSKETGLTGGQAISSLGVVVHIEKSRGGGGGGVVGYWEQ